MKKKHCWGSEIYKPYIISFLIFSFIIFTCVLYYNIIGIDSSRYSSIPLEGKGQIGDSWGMFTSVFSALAFGGLISTLIFQSAAISQAKKEADEQDKRFKGQQIENTFFRMLDIHSNLVKEIDLKQTETFTTIATGKDSFKIFYNRLEDCYNASRSLSKRSKENPGERMTLRFIEFSKRNKVVVPDAENHEELNVIGYAYRSFWNRYRSDLGHYFRFLFNIIKYIDNADLDVDEKLRYVKIVRSQLTDFEIVIIFYNSLSWMSVNKFKPLIEKYAILNNLSDDLIFDIDHKSFYAASAYENG